MELTFTLKSIVIGPKASVSEEGKFTIVDHKREYPKGNFGCAGMSAFYTMTMAIGE